MLFTYLKAVVSLGIGQYKEGNRLIDIPETLKASKLVSDVLVNVNRYFALLLWHLVTLHYIIIFLFLKVLTVNS